MSEFAFSKVARSLVRGLYAIAYRQTEAEAQYALPLIEAKLVSFPGRHDVSRAA